MRYNPSDAKKNITVALAGNPNVGKSTVFNALTGLRQHTGNWPGKTVASASGTYFRKGVKYTVIDIPGMYSLMASSAEEEVARDCICFENHDVTVVITDATCLERNLNLVLQILELKSRVIVCVNLLDEAKKKKLKIDLDELSLQLGVPVIGTSARSKKGLEELTEAIYAMASGEKKTFPVKIKYKEYIENAVEAITANIRETGCPSGASRWMALRLLDSHSSVTAQLRSHLGENDFSLLEEKAAAIRSDTDREKLRDDIVDAIVNKAEDIYKKCVIHQDTGYMEKDRRLDRLLTSKATGVPIMLCLICLIFWITVSGANYPSSLLSSLFSSWGEKLSALLISIGVPETVRAALTDGIYKTTTWVIAVMLPPMAIFFPIFTLLEDSGYMPRIAFNLDSFFKSSGASGKQSLTMCMGFGCNACGVTGCRIIDTPRERMVALLTNSLVPCNGRFPSLIAIITMFFTGAITVSLVRSVTSALILTAVILLSVAVTLLASKLLSLTLLKGKASAFALELPPYRRPQIGKVIVRSIFDRTLFVLGRAVAVAAPAGLILWLTANIYVSEKSVLLHITDFLDPAAQLIGLDGVILTAFIFGFPANEIVLPIAVMCYAATGSISEAGDLSALYSILSDNGWTCTTAICTMLFSLFHFPCSTTLLTIKKETGSLGWTVFAALFPTAIGVFLCFIVSSVSLFLGSL